MVHYIGNKKIGLIQCNNIKVKQQQHVVMNVDHDNAYHDNNSTYDTIIICNDKKSKAGTQFYIGIYMVLGPNSPPPWTLKGPNFSSNGP